MLHRALFTCHSQNTFTIAALAIQLILDIPIYLEELQLARNTYRAPATSLLLHRLAREREGTSRVGGRASNVTPRQVPGSE